MTKPFSHLGMMIPSRQASHGTIVASIAAGLTLCTIKLGVAQLLPQIAFFRMKNMCAPSTDIHSAEGDMVRAYDYLDTRANIINFSGTIDSSGSSTFEDHIKEALREG